jgi:SAM-dependent methyltransferase
MIWIYPTPSSEVLKTFYPDDNYYAYKDASGFKPKKGIKKALSAFAHPFRTVDRIIYYYGLQLRRGFPNTLNGKVLDVGCGSGLFLDSLNPMIKKYGIEFNEKSLQKCKKKGIYAFAGFKDAQFKDDIFDVVSVNHALEHFPNPLDTIKEIYRILKPGGILVIGIPNSRSIGFKLFRTKWFPLEVPRHTFLFSDRNLTAYLKSQNIYIKKVRHTAEAYCYIGSFFYTINDLFKLNKKLSDYEYLFNSSIIKLMCFPIVLLAKIFRVGDTIEIWAQKK